MLRFQTKWASFFLLSCHCYALAITHIVTRIVIHRHVPEGVTISLSLFFQGTIVRRVQAIKHLYLGFSILDPEWTPQFLPDSFLSFHSSSSSFSF